MFGSGFQFSGVTFFSAPPAVLGANNGLSIDINGNVVLGNDVGDITNPAQLLSDRHLETDLFRIELESTPVGALMLIRPEQLHLTGSISQITLDQLQSFVLISHQDVLSEPGGFSVLSVGSGIGGVFTVLNSELLIHNLGAIERYRFLPNNIFIIGTAASNGAILQVNGDITTSDPGAGQGKWELGQVQAGAVALDPNNFVEVRIDGVVRRLGIVV